MFEYKCCGNFEGFQKSMGCCHSYVQARSSPHPTPPPPFPPYTVPGGIVPRANKVAACWWALLLPPFPSSSIINTFPPLGHNAVIGILLLLPYPALLVPTYDPPSSMHQEVLYISCDYTHTYAHSPSKHGLAWPSLPRRSWREVGTWSEWSKEFGFFPLGKQFPTVLVPINHSERKSLLSTHCTYEREESLLVLIEPLNAA